MGKRKGQTHDYRVEFFQDHQAPGERPARRVRGDWTEAVLLTRNVARRPETRYARLIYVDPGTKQEHTLVHYDADHPPPDKNDDLTLGLPSLATPRRGTRNTPGGNDDRSEHHEHHPGRAGGARRRRGRR